MSRDYAGESLTKKIARAVAYQKASDILPGWAKGKARVVCLAGPEAKDLGPIDAFGVTSDPEDILFVDRDRDCLRAVEDARPGVLTHHGELSDLNAPWPIDLAVLDFCGQAFVGKNARALSRVARQMNRGGGVLVVTYSRGQETGWAAEAIDKWRNDPLAGFIGLMQENIHAFHGADLVEDKPSSTRADLARHGLVKRWIEISAGVPDRVDWKMNRGWTYVFDEGFYPYFHTYPMAISIFQIRRHWPARQDIDVGKLAKGFKSTEIPSEAESRRAFKLAAEARRARMPSKIDPSELLAFAESLEAEGVDAALALSCTRQQLAAYRAHRTMGTYSEA